ncbi:MAG: VapE domain-containing protein [Burkholderiales bacterium]
MTQGLDRAAAQMRAAGMPDFPPGHPQITDRIVRFGPRKRAWYVLRELALRGGRTVVVGAYGEFGRLESCKIEPDWQALSDDERAEAKRGREDLDRAEARKRAERAEKAANRAKCQWDAARATGTSPYLERKGVTPESKGLRFFTDGTLLVPAIDFGAPEPVLRGLQKIAPDGVKRFNKGMAKEGCACQLGKVSEGAPIVVAEGVATALSIRQALERGVAVFVAFDCGNLKAAAQRIRARHPASPIVFAADDDWQTEGNPGRRHAETAAQAICGASVVLPHWDGDREPSWTDFNDLHASRGLAAVRGQLDAGIAAARKPENAAGSPEHRASDDRPALLRDSKGRLVDCRENVYRILTTDPAWRGVIAFDEFANRIVTRKPPPWGGKPGEWTEADDARVGVWFVDALRFPIRSLDNIRAAVMLTADDATFHPVRDFLGTLTWDGTPRIDHWLVDCLACADTEYTHLAGRYSLLNMVARIYEPGCIMRAVPVLEGPQERGKSTALATLGGEWFSDTPFRVGEKDAALQIQGVWVYEIGEMQQFNRAEAAAVKQFVSSRVDNYRPPYGRRNIHVPRQTTFFGSINEQQYLRDWTGGTRFWPVRTCETGDINLAMLEDVREQLLAEAVQKYRAGERRYPSRDESEMFFAPEQEERMQEEPWEGRILDELSCRTQDAITTDEVIGDILKFEVSRITPTVTATVGRILTKAGWKRSRPGKRGETRKRVWLRPPKPVGAEAGKHDGSHGDEPF